jgi:SOS response regulatory protein OraA/RecX
MFSSDEELRGVLQKLGYNASEIADVFDVLVDKKNHWIEHRDFDEAVVTELGF